VALQPVLDHPPRLPAGAPVNWLEDRINELLTALERIALAVERIADQLERDGTKRVKQVIR
jgi:hypothetical protein